MAETRTAPVDAAGVVDDDLSISRTGND